MDGVIIEAEAYQHAVHAQNVLEAPHNWNGAAAALQNWRAVELGFQGGGRLPDENIVFVDFGGGCPSAMAGKLNLAVLGKQILHKFLNGLQDSLGLLLAHQPEGQLGVGLGG